MNNAKGYRPEGFHSVTPYLIVNGAAQLIEFMRQAFGAEVLDRMDTPEGSVTHAKVRIGDSMVELSEARPPEWPALTSGLHLYVEDADAVYERAIAAGAVSLRPPTDQFYGDREADITDPSGNQWYIATHKLSAASSGQ